MGGQQKEFFKSQNNDNREAVRTSKTEIPEKSNDTEKIIGESLAKILLFLSEDPANDIWYRESKQKTMGSG